MKERPDFLPGVTLFLVALGLTGAFLAPPDQLQGQLQRLMYVHVPAAWLAYASFALTVVGSVGWLWRRELRYDRLAESAAEVGVFFTGLAIVLGSVWGKPVWGVWWTWDPRLVTTALLFFVYLGYLALRRSITGPTNRARVGAVFGIVAFVQVPIVHFSVLWWRALHQPPTVLRPGDPTMDHTMLAVLLLNLLAFTFLGAWLLRTRMRLAGEVAAWEKALDQMDPQPAWDTVQPPSLGKGTSDRG